MTLNHDQLVLSLEYGALVALVATLLWRLYRAPIANVDANREPAFDMRRDGQRLSV